MSEAPLYRGTSLIGTSVQGYLAHKKAPPPTCRALQLACAQGPMVVLGRGALSYGENPCTPNSWSVSRRPMLDTFKASHAGHVPCWTLYGPLSSLLHYSRHRS